MKIDTIDGTKPWPKDDGTIEYNVFLTTDTGLKLKCNAKTEDRWSEGDEITVTKEWPGNLWANPLAGKGAPRIYKPVSIDRPQGSRPQRGNGKQAPRAATPTTAQKASDVIEFYCEAQARILERTRENVPLEALSEAIRGSYAGAATLTIPMIRGDVQDDLTVRMPRKEFASEEAKDRFDQPGYQEAMEQDEIGF